jgi:hypothetical protein
MIYTTSDAVAALGFVNFWGPDDNLKYPDGVTPPTEDAIQAKLAELKEGEPIHLLRVERDKRLASSDWTGLSDSALTSEVSAKWKLYRQKLRDLPAGLDTVDKVKAVTWPEKPE